MAKVTKKAHMIVLFLMVQTQFYSNHHFNDTVDGAVNLPYRA